MTKLKYWIAVVLGSLGILFVQTTYAACTVAPTHVSGVTTVHISKYGMNYPITRGEFVFYSSSQVVTNCGGALGGIRFTGPKSLTKSSDTQGNDAWELAGSSFGIEPFVNYIGPGTTIWADGEGSTGNFLKLTTQYGINMVSISALSPPDGASSVVYNISEPVGYVWFGSENYNVEHIGVYLDSLTVNYVVTSCGINAKQGSTINWPNLYKAEIVNGTAESKPYGLSFICGDASAPPSPINISFSSTNGFADAANGIVKTNLENLGIKLSWANPALPPLVLDQVNHSSLSGVGDYTVMAKPVKLSKLTDALQAGQFDTTVTMNIEFE
ncbi:fimbrial protein [Rahnella sp. PCH160]|uniref:fimbrial protein n=1 Tax=Rahnella sp. PCH160 TaxID=3447928 RepID=UPI0039FBFD2C